MSLPPLACGPVQFQPWSGISRSDVELHVAHRLRDRGIQKQYDAAILRKSGILGTNAIQPQLPAVVTPCEPEGFAILGVLQGQLGLQAIQCVRRDFEHHAPCAFAILPSPYDV